jgi:hypothetical protein
MEPESLLPFSQKHTIEIYPDSADRILTVISSFFIRLPKEEEYKLWNPSLRAIFLFKDPVYSLWLDPWHIFFVMMWNVCLRRCLNELCKQ